MRRLTFISIALTFLLFVLEFNYPPQLLLQILIMFIYIRLSWYLISVLQFAGENVTVQTPFTILLVLYILKIFSPLLMQGQAMPLDVFYVIIAIYATLTTFKIKNQRFSGVFRIYAILMLMSALLNSAILLLIFLPLYLDHSNYLNIIDMINVLPLYAILSITRKVTLSLQENTKPVLTGIIP